MNLILTWKKMGPAENILDFCFIQILRSIKVELCVIFGKTVKYSFEM